MNGGSKERFIEIKERLWELDEEYFQRWFEEREIMRESRHKKFIKSGDIRNKQMEDDYTNQLCHKYKFRREELDRVIKAGYVNNDSRASRLYSQYKKGVRENCL